jgi:hypothetical protein
MKTRQRILILFLIAAVLLAACAGSSGEESVAAPSMPASRDEADMAEEPASDGFGFDSDDGSIVNTTTSVEPAQQGNVQERLIIRTGQLDIIVEDTEATLDEIERRVNALEGWVVSSNVYQYSTP